MAQKAAIGVWGIDLGQCALKALRVELSGGEVTATAYDYIEYPKILSQPDADPDELTREALNNFLSRNTLRGDIVVISVPGQSGLARFVKLPPVEEKKISDIVKFEAKQQIPFPLEEVVWDFQKLGSGMVTDGYALDTEIGLFAMKRDMVNRYMQHFKDVRVEVHIVQMAPLALCNFVAYDLLNKGAESSGAAEEEDQSEEDEAAGKKKCIVALDIGTDNSNLVITDGERIIWQRPIPIGGNHFTRALTKDLKLTFAKAEHLKRNAMKSPDLKKILGSLRPVLNDFVSEVQRSLGYFTNTHRDAHIKYMIGLGNAFRLPGLQKFLQEKLQIDVRKLQKIRRLEGDSVTSAPQFTENILSFAVAEGLALQGLKASRLQTNLLPQEIQFERMVRAKKPWAVAAAALLMAAIAFLGVARAVEHAAQADPLIAKNLKEGKELMDTATKTNAEFTDLNNRTKATEETVLRVAAGVNERFNWNLFYKYVNDMLPTPDGQHLAIKSRTLGDVKNIYYSKESGQAALELLKKRRLDLSQERTPTAQDARDDETIKRDLVAINIEGITSMYADDLKPVADHLKAMKFDANLLTASGMADAEATKLMTEPDKLKEPGWVVEIRGYTYHQDKVRFVIKTFVENLAYPENIYPNLYPKEVDPKSKKKIDPLKTHVRDRLRYVFLYGSRTDSNPQPGEFQVIRKSYLQDVLSGVSTEAAPGAQVGKRKGFGPPSKQPEGEGQTGERSRDGWTVLGRVANEALGGTVAGGKGPGGAALFSRFNKANTPTSADPNKDKENPREGLVLTPRTEFVIYLVWIEQLTPEGTAVTTPATPATPATPPNPQFKGLR